MRAYLNRRYHFSAAHRLHTDALSAEQNRATFGKCNNPHGHGHNYTVEVTFGGPMTPPLAWSPTSPTWTLYAQQHLLGPFDHTNLNTLPLFATLVPTTENLAVQIHKIFAAYPHAELTRLHVEETQNNAFDYAGPELTPVLTRKPATACSCPSFVRPVRART